MFPSPSLISCPSHSLHGHIPFFNIWIKSTKGSKCKIFLVDDADQAFAKFTRQVLMLKLNLSHSRTISLYQQELCLAVQWLALIGSHSTVVYWLSSVDLHLWTLSLLWIVCKVACGFRNWTSSHYFGSECTWMWG